MPGVSVPPRPAGFDHDADLARLAAKLKGEDTDEDTDADEKKPAKRGRDEANQTLTMRLAGKLGVAAGKGALERTLEAGRKASTGGMSQMFHRVETRNVAVAGVATVKTRPQTPGFAALFPGALLAPLRKGSLPAIIGGIAMLTVALLMLELSPLLGLVALAVAGVELLALRLKYVRDSAHGKDNLLWPEWSEVLSALPMFPAALVVFLPALVVGLLALGGGVWDSSQPGSIPARAKRMLSAGDPSAPSETALPGATEERVLFGRTGLVMLEAAIGSPRAGYDARTPEQIAQDVRATGLKRLQRWLVPTSETEPLGLAARALGWLALLVFPMGLLAVAKLESGYAALHAPLLVRSILRTALHYPVVVIFFLVQDVVIVMTALNSQPFFQAKLGSLGGHLAAVGCVSIAVVVLPVITGSLLGRFYRSHANELGWEG